MSLHPDLCRGLPALSVMQPWTWLLAEGHKDIENRNWWTNFRGEVLLHAGLRWDTDARDDVLQGVHPVTGYALPAKPASIDVMCRGGIVGIARITDCVSESTSRWFVGRYGFLMADARPLPFTPCKGALGFFQPKFEEAARG